MIRLDQWGTKGSLVALVRLCTLDDPEVGDRPIAIARRVVEAVTGVPNRYAYRLFAELVHDRVLVRVEGAGSRAHGYAINDPRKWLHVPWRVTTNPDGTAPSRVLLALELSCAGPPPTTEEAVVARYSAPLAPFVARHGAPQNSVLARSERAKTSGLLARHVAPQRRAPDPAPTSSSFPLDDDEGKELPEGFDRVHAAIVSRTGRPLFGEPLRQVALLVDELGTGPAIAIAEKLARDLGPRMIVEAFRASRVPVATSAAVRTSANWEEPAPAWDETRAKAALGGAAAARAALRREAVGGVCETATDQESL